MLLRGKAVEPRWCLLMICPLVLNALLFFNA